MDIDAMPHLTPAAYVIRMFGGVRPLARELNKSPSSVSRWRKPRQDGGLNGAVPTGEQRRILELAESKGIDVSAEDLILGRDVPDSDTAR